MAGGVYFPIPECFSFSVFDFHTNWYVAGRSEVGNKMDGTGLRKYNNFLFFCFMLISFGG
jgi:hypothetical protein